MGDCINVTTVLTPTRLSTFCAELSNATQVFEELLPNLLSEYVDEFILDVVSKYGKQTVMPGDITVMNITILLTKRVVDVDLTRPSAELDSALLRLVALSPFKVYVMGREVPKGGPDQASSL
jgi:hypothetical protein